MRRGSWLLAAASLTLSLCAGAAVPQRVVSLDYCADQFVLEFVAPASIAALSPDATEPFSYLREQAAGKPQVRPLAEDVLLLQPDLVVASYGADDAFARLLDSAGIPLQRIGWIDSLAALRTNLLEVGAALGAAGQAQALHDDFDARLAALAAKPSSRQPRVLYVTPGGVTAGTGTVVDELLRAAGLRNFSTRPGWQPLPLERLAYEVPDAVVHASFVADQHPWSAARHPLLQERLAGLPSVSLPGAWTACGGWFLIEAIEAMAVLRE